MSERTHIIPTGLVRIHGAQCAFAMSLQERRFAFIGRCVHLRATFANPR